MANRILLVYFSRTGHTRKVAMDIASALGCDVEEIRDRVGRGGLVGYARSSLEAIARFDTLLAQTRHDPADYDLVVVGTPIWFWSLSSPVRTWARRHRDDLRKVAFFCTCGSPGGQRALAELEALYGSTVASLALTDREIDAGQIGSKVATFVEGLAAGTRPRARTATTARG
ncbi:MAG: flavodoxin [Burkholderiaceae bacterium]|nr:flavodoxin [Burkholderiaceae bacterium]